MQIVCVDTAALLFAGRFGLAPTVNKNYGGSGGVQELTLFTFQLNLSALYGKGVRVRVV
jgi:hypothetical protein